MSGAATYPDGYGQDWVDARCHLCPARFDSLGSLNEHLGEDHGTDSTWSDRDFDPIEQERRWAALDASVPCAHPIPGTCDYC